MAELLMFEIENYRSFLETQKIEFGDENARTVTALYGPNAGGKSNVVKALKTMLSCIVGSANAGWRLPYDPFLLREGFDSKPTRFKLVFKSKGRRFTYSFAYNRDRIVFEEMLEKSANSKKQRTIFIRDEGNKLNSTAVKNGFGKRLHGKTRPETLLITKGREDNNEYANFVFDLLNSIVLIDDDDDAEFKSPYYIEMLKRDASLRERVVELLQRCDIAIRGVKVETVPLASNFDEGLPFNLPGEVRNSMLQQGATTFKTMHAIRDDELTVTGFRELDFWHHESTGTRKFFEIIVPIVSAIDNRQTVIIDEFGSYIHPDLASAVISMFRNQEQSDEVSKLVLITHSTSMMSSDLQREDVYLVSKTLGEESRIVSLTESGARKDDAFEKRYRAGYYGALPFIKER